MPATEIVAIVTGIIGCVTAVVTITPCVRQPMEECYGYLANREEKLRKIKKIEGKLQTIRRDNWRYLILKDIKFYERWLEEARQVHLQIENCCNVEDESFYPLCPCLGDYYTRYKIGKNIAKITVRANALIEEFQQKIERETAGEQKRICRKELVGRQRNDVMYDMWMCTETRKVIGVYGANGVGKTEVVAHLCNEMLQKKDGSIESLIWVEASEDDDVKKLQMKLASQIDLSLLSGGSVSENATKLMQALLRTYKRGTLLVLDNIGKAFSLDEIGISPINKMLKVITITRSSSVCRQMKPDQIFEVKLLSDEEAYQLLVNEVGFEVSYLPEEIKSSMKKIAEECGGLPLAIISIATFLRKLNWNDYDAVDRALKKEVAAFSNSKYIEDKVFADLEHSYEQLKNSRHSCIQECFLFCSLYPRNHAFVASELVKCWIGEGLLGEVEIECIDEKLGEAQEILNELKDASLLASVDDENGVEKVKLPSLVWDMAVDIIKANPRFFTEPQRGLGKTTYEDWPEYVERVLLIRNYPKELQTGKIFRNLLTLVLLGNSIDIQDDGFFNSFPKLKILDLSNTSVTILPESVSFLKHLTVLLLRNCKGLTCLPSLSELVALLVLDVSGSPITELPPGMNCLTKLVSLNLSRTRLRGFPLHLVEKLYNLRELLMIGCDFLFMSRSQMQDNSVACMEDVQEHQLLGILEIPFLNTQTFFDYISSGHWRRLKSFKFCVGSLYNAKLGNNNSLAFIKEFPNVPFWLNTSGLLVLHYGDVAHQMTLSNLQTLKSLDISNCSSLKYILTVAALMRLVNLEEMVIAHCPNLEMVIEKNEGNPVACDRFIWPRLRRLIFYNLPELRFFYHDEMFAPYVRTFEIWSCPKLEIFPFWPWPHHGEDLTSRPIRKEVRGDRSWLQCSTDPNQSELVTLLESTLIEDPPPEEFNSRSEMVVPLEG